MSLNPNHRRSPVCAYGAGGGGGGGSSGVAQVTQVVCVADNGGDLADKYFVIHDADGSVGVWMSLNGMGSPPLGVDRAIQVEYDSEPASYIAQQVANYINGDAAFSAVADGDIATITDATTGQRTNAADVDTGFAITTTIEGS